jgi:hypothetical protein
MSDRFPSIYDVQESAPMPEYPKPSFSNGRIIAIVLLATGALILTCLLSAGLFLGRQVLDWTAGKNRYTLVMNSFMTSMQRDDFNGAHDLFSKKGQEVSTIEQLEGMKKGANAAIFDHYQGVNIDFIGNTSSINTDPYLSGKFVVLKGTVLYSDGYVGQLSARLHFEAGEWKIYGVNITIPPEKIEKFIKASNELPKVA